MKPKFIKKRAVALQYNPKSDAAPRVTAKGQDHMAERIVELARMHAIPVREDPDLVQILSQVEVTQEIPAPVYHLVAELLAWVYQLNAEFQGNPLPLKPARGRVLP